MKSSQRETLVYLVAFGLALALRMIHLGALPLTDAEARLALQALGVARGAGPDLSSQTAYILPTAVLFFAFAGGTNFLARLIPALAGSALVFAPLLFREQLKPRPGMILAVFIALDPGLLALSRQAGGTILAVTFLLFAWAFWAKGEAPWAGVFGALALMSGPQVWAGLLGLGLAWAIRQGLEARRPPEGAHDTAPRDHKMWPAALAAGAGTLILGGTLFLLAPKGLGAWAASLYDYLRGWGEPSGVPVRRLLIALVLYAPLPVIFGLTGIVRGWVSGSWRAVRLSLWALVALLLALFYPGRQVADLIWVLLPLSALAALELARHLDWGTEERAEVAGSIGLVAFVLMAAWMSLATIAQNPLDPANTIGLPVALFGKLTFTLPPRPISLLLVLMFILVVSVLLVAMGWSTRMARLGAVWGSVLALTAYSFAAAWGAAGLRVPLTPEMWSEGARPDQADLLLTTVDQVSDWTQGDEEALAVTIVGIDSPALGWLLRDHPVELTDSLDPTAAPALVITGEQQELGSQVPYRGQDFVWRQEPMWDNALAGDWLRWIVFRQMPQIPETLILWARNDLFLDSRAAP